MKIRVFQIHKQILTWFALFACSYVSRFSKQAKFHHLNNMLFSYDGSPQVLENVENYLSLNEIIQPTIRQS